MALTVRQMVLLNRMMSSDTERAARAERAYMLHASGLLMQNGHYVPGGEPRFLAWLTRVGS